MRPLFGQVFGKPGPAEERHRWARQRFTHQVDMRDNHRPRPRGRRMRAVVADQPMDCVLEQNARHGRTATAPVAGVDGKIAALGDTGLCQLGHVLERSGGAAIGCGL